MTISPEPVPGFQTPPNSWPGASTNPGAGTPVSAEQVEAWRSQFIELILRQVVLALTNFLNPGNAFDQLKSWASSIPVVGDLVDQLIGDDSFIGGLINKFSVNNGFLSLISEPVQRLIDVLIGILRGIPIVGGSLADLLEEFNDFYDDTQATAADASDAKAGVQTLGTTIFQAITNGLPSADLFGDILTAIRNFPSSIVSGVGGPGNIGDSVRETWNQLLGGFVGANGSGAELADLFNIGHTISSRATLGQYSWDTLSIRSNKSLRTGFLPSSQSNITLDKVSLGTSMSTVAVTQSTALLNYERVGESIDIGAVSWQGSGVTNITDCYINIYKMDTSTGVNTLMHASTNQVGLLSASMAPVVYSLPSSLHFDPGEIFGMEVAIRGTGTHNMAGSQYALPDQNVYPRRWSSVRNSGTSAPPASFTPTYGTNVAFIEYAVSAGAVAIPRTPEITLFSSGTSSVPIPAWVNYVEVVALGGGGGGHQGGTWGIGGEGGDNGAWSAATWARGTDFTGSPSMSITVGAGGSAGVGGNGGSGGNSVVSITGHTVTATGGVGANSFDIAGSEHTGEPADNFTYGGQIYVGGGAQSTYGGRGAAPGGGGAGGNWVSFQPGGAGATGAVWIRYRQS